MKTWPMWPSRFSWVFLIGKMLSQQAIAEYQTIHKKVYGKKISQDEAMQKGMELLRLFQLVYKPIPKRESGIGQPVKKYENIHNKKT